jgi:dimethylamine/trimethylamine dehydrogenase
MEQHRIQRRLLELGVEIVASHAVTSTARDGVRVQCVFTGRDRHVSAAAAVFVTARLPNDAVYQGLVERRADWAEAGLKTVHAVGDCLAPGTIAAAVCEGRRYAEELGEPSDRGDTVPFRREVTALADLG